MMHSLPIARLAAVCKQYGPGRLPYADRREIGAGYAMATTAAVATVMFVLVTFVLVTVVPGLSDVSLVDPVVRFGVIAFPIVIPSAFVSGVVVVWRLATPNLPRYGSVAGAATTGLTYLVGTLVVGVFLLIAYLPILLRGLSTVGEILTLVAPAPPVYGIFAFLYTFWLTLPLGALGGAIYERTRTASIPER